ncbi:hypothetical protein AQUCO_01600169v1 [Aquilegia coerulea]|uniref:Uncharacterized protein n=1 Tax=Aquilegia coerulea TaxID=218851 RepID=A0A2G5DQD9_AQUCA|nr:hypothetical protein AQUCO_01600169v1 [Aquilegia coerulea]
MEGKPNLQIESYPVFDSRPLNEAIAFIIGSGKYLEYEGLLELNQRQQPVKHIHCTWNDRASDRNTVC